MRTYIIVEAGVNHNGQLDLALKLCDAAKAAGVDAVKFQTWKTENIVTAHARQDAPSVWQQNGSIYVINPKSLMEKGMAHFARIRKYAMSELYSVDIDNPFDWKVAELVVNEKMLG